MRGLVGTMMEARGTLHGGSSPSNGGGWFSQVFGSGTTVAGVNVTEQNAINLSTVWACVNGISQDVAKVPLHRYMRLADGGREKLSTPSTNLLLMRPNPEMSAISFRETLQLHAMNWGNGVAEIERDKSGKPVALWPWRPDQTSIGRMQGGVFDGTIFYEYTDRNGRITRLMPEDILHVHGLGFDGLTGYSVVRVAAESIGAAKAADQFAASAFAKGGIPTGVLKHPGKLKEGSADRVRREWQKLYGGPNPQFRVAVMEEGLDFVPMTMPMEDMQLLQSRQFGVSEICRWYRYPPHKAGDLSRSTFGNIEQSELSYSGDCLHAWWVRWEQECWAKLLMPSQRETMYWEHLVDAALRTDTSTRYTAYGMALDKGWMNRNEVREKENMNPLPNGEGDLFLVQLAQTPIGDLGKGDTKPGDTLSTPPSTPDDPNADLGATAPLVDVAAKKKKRSDELLLIARRVVSAQHSVIEDAVRSLTHAEADKARRANSRGELRAWVNGYYPAHAERVASKFFPFVEASSKMFCMLAGLEESIVNRGEVVQDIASGHVKRSCDALSSSDKIEQRLSAWEVGYESSTSRSVQDTAKIAEVLAEKLAKSALI